MLNLAPQAFAEAAPDSTPALPQIEEKGTKTAGVGSSVARSDRSVPQARLAMTSPAGTHCPICSSCAAVHVCVESRAPHAAQHLSFQVSSNSLIQICPELQEMTLFGGCQHALAGRGTGPPELRPTWR